MQLGLLMGLTMVGEIKQESGFNLVPIIFETAPFQVLAYVTLGNEHIAHLLFSLHPPGCDFVSF